jgi:hypothetical protein
MCRISETPEDLKASCVTDSRMGRVTLHLPARVGALGRETHLMHHARKWTLSPGGHQECLEVSNQERHPQMRTLETETERGDRRKGVLLERRQR